MQKYKKCRALALKKVANHWSALKELKHVEIRSVRGRERKDKEGTTASQSSRGQAWVNTHSTYCWHCTAPQTHTQPCTPADFHVHKKQKAIRPISRLMPIGKEGDTVKEGKQVCEFVHNRPQTLASSNFPRWISLGNKVFSVLKEFEITWLLWCMKGLATVNAVLVPKV